MARNKGKRGEREVIALLQPILNEVYETFDLDCPTLQRNTLQSDDGGCDICGLEWLSLEVKFQETLQLPAWWQQTLEQAGREKTPILIFRQGRKRWQVMMHAWLFVGTDSSELVVVMSVDVFLRWFRARLVWELSK